MFHFDSMSSVKQVLFTVGQRSKTIRVDLLNGEVDEDDEAFQLVLSNPSGARIADATATGTITE